MTPASVLRQLASVFLVCSAGISKCQSRRVAHLIQVVSRRQVSESSCQEKSADIADFNCRFKGVNVRGSSAMKTEEKSSSMLRVRIAVLGKINVGKSALTVRYLTRRYIGEYRSNTDLLYRQIVTVNNTPLDIEIVDVSGETRDSIFPLEQVQWADACVVVYSITDRESFDYAVEVLENFQKLRPVNSVPVTLLANKADLEHLREVDEIEGRTAAIQNGCQFYEVSVAENTSDLYQAFEFLVNECRLQINTNITNTKSRKFSVSKMIGTLIGNGNGKGIGHHNGSQPPQGGTVVVCHKADLHKSRVLKRRQNYTATASL